MFDLLWRGVLLLACCLLLFSCDAEGLWFKPEKECNPLTNPTIRGAALWKKTFEQGQAPACLRVSWGTGKDHAVGIYVALLRSGELKAYKPNSEELTASLKISIPRESINKERSFDLFIFGSSLHKNEQRDQCLDVIGKSDYSCDFQENKVCWFSISFQPKPQTAHLKAKKRSKPCTIYPSLEPIQKEPIQKEPIQKEPIQKEPIQKEPQKEPQDSGEKIQERDVRPREQGRTKEKKSTPFQSEEVLISTNISLIGSPKNEPGRDTNESLHQVRLTKDFYLWRHEVTQGEFERLMPYNPSSFRSCGLNCPVETVSWHEAVAFCNEASTLSKLPQCYDCKGTGKDVMCVVKSAFTGSHYTECKGYRLPTESEWEYAYRAGSSSAFYNGKITSTAGKDPNLEKIAWYRLNSNGKTHPVGQKEPNHWGLFDMSGNVLEWVFDRFAAYPNSPTIDPVGPSTGSIRSNRGGSWNQDALFCRAAFRGGIGAGFRFNVMGFRVARTR